MKKKYVTQPIKREDETDLTPAIYVEKDNGLREPFIDVFQNGTVRIILDHANEGYPLFMYKNDEHGPAGLPAVIRCMTDKLDPETIPEVCHENECLDYSLQSVPTVVISGKTLVNVDELPHELKDKVKRWTKRKLKDE